VSERLTPQQLSEKAAVLRQATSEHVRWELPERYRVTPAMLALPDQEFREKHPDQYHFYKENEAQQEQWRRQLNDPAAQPSAQDMVRGQSVQMAAELSLLAQRIKRERDALLVSGGEEGTLEQLQAALIAVNQRRGESYAQHGRYDLAIQVDPREERRQHYREIVDAIEADDHHKCDCEPRRGSGEHRDITVSRVYVEDEIFSSRHGQVVFLLRCSGCGWRNAVPQLPDFIVKDRARRKQVLALVKDLSPADAHRVLVANKLTSRALQHV
jgi:hypothetical protein